MAKIGSYGAADIIAVPNSPGLKQIELGMNDTVAMSTSPWTGQAQAQWFPNDAWDGQITLPLMNIDQIGAWEAWLSELRGMKNVFPLGNPLRAMPRGRVNHASSPFTNGVSSAMATSLALKGFAANQVRLLLPGDHLQVGYRLHRVLNVVNSDGFGQANVDIWPIVREDIPDNTAVIFLNPKGLFRLAENRRSVTQTETRMGGVTVKIMEAK